MQEGGRRERRRRERAQKAVNDVVRGGQSAPAEKRSRCGGCQSIGTPVSRETLYLHDFTTRAFFL